MSRIAERASGTSRLIRKGADDGAFDRDFWGAIPPAARLEQAWEMVLEFEA